MSTTTALTLASLFTCAPAAAQIIADSVADYSGTQGQGGWHYGFYDGDQPAPFAPADFEPFPLYGVQGADIWSRTPYGPGGYWTRMRAEECLPNGARSVEGRLAGINHPARRWVSDHDGQILLTGRLWKVHTTAGNGVRGIIFVDAAQVWSESIGRSNSVGVTYRVGVCVSVGSVIDWAVDPVNGDNAGDVCGFTATVTARQCYANCDCSADLDVFDFLCFQNRFAALDPYACECDTSTGPGVCDVFDFLCFQNAFAAGCP